MIETYLKHVRTKHKKDSTLGFSIVISLCDTNCNCKETAANSPLPPYTVIFRRPPYMFCYNSSNKII